MPATSCPNPRVGNAPQLTSNLMHLSNLVLHRTAAQGMWRRKASSGFLVVSIISKRYHQKYNRGKNQGKFSLTLFSVVFCPIDICLSSHVQDANEPTLRQLRRSAKIWESPNPCIWENSKGCLGLFTTKFVVKSKWSITLWDQHG